MKWFLSGGYLFVATMVTGLVVWDSSPARRAWNTVKRATNAVQHSWKRLGEARRHAKNVKLIAARMNKMWPWHPATSFHSLLGEYKQYDARDIVGALRVRATDVHGCGPTAIRLLNSVGLSERETTEREARALHEAIHGNGRDNREPDYANVASVDEIMHEPDVCAVAIACGISHNVDAYRAFCKDIRDDRAGVTTNMQIKKLTAVVEAQRAAADTKERADALLALRPIVDQLVLDVAFIKSKLPTQPDTEKPPTKETA